MRVQLGRLRLPSAPQLARQLTGAASRSQQLYELAADLPRYGVDARFYRKSWLRNGWDPAKYYWHITKIRLPQPEESAVGLQRGRVWGTLVWNGVAHGRSMLVRKASKRDWAAAPNSTPLPEMAGAAAPPGTSRLLKQPGGRGAKAPARPFVAMDES
jgi:hypothetical protein